MYFKWFSTFCLVFIVGDATIILGTEEVDCSSGNYNCQDNIIICTNEIDSCDILCNNDGDCRNTTVYTSASATNIDCSNQYSCINMSIYCGDLSVGDISFPSSFTINNFTHTEANVVSCTITGDSNAQMIYNVFMGCYGNVIDECNILADGGDPAIEDTTLDCYTNSSCWIDCESGGCSNNKVICEKGISVDGCHCDESVTSTECSEYTPSPTISPTSITNTNTPINTDIPTISNTPINTNTPTNTNTNTPINTDIPTISNAPINTNNPTNNPISNTAINTDTPTNSNIPINTNNPTNNPISNTPINTDTPTNNPISIPNPTLSPHNNPTSGPLYNPTDQPSRAPTKMPSNDDDTNNPTNMPSKMISHEPTKSPLQPEIAIMPTSNDDEGETDSSNGGVASNSDDNGGSGSNTQIWRVVALLLGLGIIGCCVVFVIRHCNKKSKITKENIARENFYNYRSKTKNSNGMLKEPLLTDPNNVEMVNGNEQQDEESSVIIHNVE